MSTDEKDRELLAAIHEHDELAREIACRRARIDRWASDLERVVGLLKHRGAGVDRASFPESQAILSEYKGLRNAEDRLLGLKDRERQLRGV